MPAKVNRKKISDYRQDDKNLNKGNAFGEGLIEKSLQRFGAGRSMLSSSDDVLIAGNKTHSKLAQAGIKEIIEVETDGTTAVIVKRTDIKSGTKKFHELALADNAAAKANITFDTTAIIALSEQYNFNAGEWGIDIKEKLYEDDFQVPDIDKLKTDIKPGDIFQIGNHRLMCGDSCKLADVKKLMGKAKADLVFTDPPYGVSYEGVQGSAKKKYGTIKNDDLAGDKLEAFLTASFRNMHAHTKDNTPAYIWFASRNHITFEQALNKSGYEVKQELIWNKGMILGRSDYHWAHEPVLYCKKKNQTTSWHGDRTPKTIMGQRRSELTALKKEELVRIIKNLLDASTTWELDRDKVITYQHPTQKPVTLSGRAITNSCPAAGIVLDTFVGSGATMVASEQLGCSCYAMDLEPKWCAVILQRMATLIPGIRITRNGKPYKVIIKVKAS